MGSLRRSPNGDGTDPPRLHDASIPIRKRLDSRLDSAGAAGNLSANAETTRCAGTCAIGAAAARIANGRRRRAGHRCSSSSCSVRASLACRATDIDDSTCFRRGRRDRRATTPGIAAAIAPATLTGCRATEPDVEATNPDIETTDPEEVAAEVQGEPTLSSGSAALAGGRPATLTIVPATDTERGPTLRKDITAALGIGATATNRAIAALSLIAALNAAATCCLADAVAGRVTNANTIARTECVRRGTETIDGALRRGATGVRCWSRGVGAAARRNIAGTRSADVGYTSIACCSTISVVVSAFIAVASRARNEDAGCRE